VENECLPWRRTLWWHSLVVGSETRWPVPWQPVSVDEAGAPPRYIKLATVAARSSFAAIGDWAQEFTGEGCEVSRDGLACFRAAVARSRCFHHPCGRKGSSSNEFTQNSVGLTRCFSNLKTSFSGSLHAPSLEKYADRYLAPSSYRFNRRVQYGGNDRACGS